MKSRSLLICILLAAPVLAPAASKEIQELQRDVALLQQQIKDLQRSQDEKFATVTELARQAIEAANRANTGVAVITSSLDKNLRDQTDKVTAPLQGFGTRVNEMGGDVRTLQQAVGDLTAILGRMQAQLTDISNSIKVMQAPPPPAPGATSTGGAPVAGGSDMPPMSAQKLYETARADYSGGKYDLAAQEFADYLRYYGNTDLAPNAQFYIALIHYGQKNYDDAIKEFDMVLEKYPDNNKTAESLLYKGRALVKTPGHKTDGAAEFMEVIKRFPKSDEATQACNERKSLGLNCGAPASAPARTPVRRKK
ncbi:MAG: Tetratricopeptide 2 repeat protein [Candidatus Solibacter sp.]|jgi:tol-pal system protein YbgF|nr:Tetratricopeptide 2 repeat protein [Candidatus Solibacter sp.]